MSDHLSHEGEIQLIGMHESLSPQLLHLIYSQTPEQYADSEAKSLFQLLLDFFKR